MARLGRLSAFAALTRALFAARRPGAPGLGEQLRAVPRMLSAGFTGRYPHLDRSAVALAGLAALYVLSPIDVLPEVLLPVIGLGDDAFVLAWLVGTVLAQTEAFLHWERSRPGAGGSGRVVRGEVVP